MDQQATLDKLRRLATRRHMPATAATDTGPGADMAPPGPGGTGPGDHLGERPGMLRRLLGLAHKDAPREQAHRARRAPGGPAGRKPSRKRADGPDKRQDGAQPPGPTPPDPKPGEVEARDTTPPAAPDTGEKRPSKLVYAVPASLIIGVLAWGAWTHWNTSRQAAAAQQEAADFLPTVRTATAKREDGPVTLTLPGATAPFDAARLYARATGFVSERRVDIGSRVRRGDLLLRIAAPDLNAQLAQAAAQLGQTKAALVQAQANVVASRSTVDLARVTNSRTSTLAAQGWETRQNADTTKAGLQRGTAGVDAAQAAVTVTEAVSAQPG